MSAGTVELSSDDSHSDDSLGSKYRYLSQPETCPLEELRGTFNLVFIFLIREFGCCEFLKKVWFSHIIK